MFCFCFGLTQWRLIQHPKWIVVKIYTPPLSIQHQHKSKFLPWGVHCPSDHYMRWMHQPWNQIDVPPCGNRCGCCVNKGSICRRTEESRKRTWASSVHMQLHLHLPWLILAEWSGTCTLVSHMHLQLASKSESRGKSLVNVLTT